MSENPGSTGRPANPNDGLTPRQRLFALEYLKDFNGKQAAIRAGYSAHSAEVTASKLLRVPKVRAFVEQGQAKVERRVEVDAAYVIRSLKSVAERCQQAEPVMVRRGREMVQLTDEEGRNVWRFDSAGANTALSLLGKHLALFTEKQEVSGPGGGPLEVVIRDLGAEPKDPTDGE